MPLFMLYFQGPHLYFTIDIPRPNRMIQVLSYPNHETYGGYLYALFVARRRKEYINQERSRLREGIFSWYVMWVGRASFTFHAEHGRNTNPLPSRSWKKCDPESGGAFPPRYPHLLESRLTGTGQSWSCPCRVQGDTDIRFQYKGIHYAARLSQQFGALSHRNKIHRVLFYIYLPASVINNKWSSPYLLD